MERRRFLVGSMAAAGAALSGCSPPSPSYPPQSGEPFEGSGPFPSGIGSGDPLHDAVLLWTRVHPDRDRTGRGVALVVEVATDPSCSPSSIVATFAAVARPERDHCVTVDATDLAPSTTYWYRFRDGEVTSPVGRTRTAPAPGSRTGRVRVAAFSCQRWTHGWFTSHADLAALADDPATDVDLVVCLGDYVYNTGYADKVYVPGRDDPIQDAITVEDFRSKYRLYRSDPDLRAMHARFPVVHVFDNHDGLDGPGDRQTDGALQAFFEHVPVRGRGDAPGRFPDIYRSVRWGDDLELFVTDQRRYRDPTLPESSPIGTTTEERPEILDPGRTMLGASQRTWLLDGLTASTADWKLVGSQLMFWPWRTLPRLPGQPRGAGMYLNLTQWDGYAAERLALLDHLERHDVRDTLLVSGDSHVFSAAQVAPDVDDARSIPRVLEFGTGSVTSNNADETGYPGDEVTGPLFFNTSPNHLRYFESERHGYALLDITPERTVVEFRSPTSIRERHAPMEVLAVFDVGRGSQHIGVTTATPTAVAS